MPANRLEMLAYWYLRFNGYFTTCNFTVHPDFRCQPGGTDADILAVRFPHSQEYQVHYNFERDPQLVLHDKIDFLICEVKTGLCDINHSTWQNPSRNCVEYALRWFGFSNDNLVIENAASAIYTRGAWQSTNSGLVVRFCCFGIEENPIIANNMPLAIQLTHINVISYLKERFNYGCNLINRVHWGNEIDEFAQMSKVLSPGDLLDWAKSQNI